MRQHKHQHQHQHQRSLSRVLESRHGQNHSLEYQAADLATLRRNGLRSRGLGQDQAHGTPDATRNRWNLARDLASALGSDPLHRNRSEACMDVFRLHHVCSQACHADERRIPSHVWAWLYSQIAVRLSMHILIPHILLALHVTYSANPCPHKRSPRAHSPFLQVPLC
jgi:hypothetical protein